MIGGRVNLVLVTLLVLACLLALAVGSTSLGLGDVLTGLVGNPESDKAALIVREIRLPRLVAGLMVGASLGLAGAALQGLLKNPLADPGVIGVSASASLGAVIALYYGLSAVSAYAVPGFALAGALLSTSLLYVFARRDPSALTLILVGIALSHLAGALTSLAMNLSPNPFSLGNIVMWLLGSLANRSEADILLALPFMLPGWVLLMMAGPSLAHLTLDDDVAESAGVNLRRVRFLVIVGSALAVGASVAIAGTIGFVGLMVPHMIRPFVGHDPARLLLPSALGGALLVTLADALLRVIPTEQELKLGVLTALLGVPFFLALILKTRRQMR